jgi:hypothetical protein
MEIPRLRPKYAWMEPMFRWKIAKWVRIVLAQVKASLVSCWDQAMYSLETRLAFRSHILNPMSLTHEDSEWRG